MICGVPEYLLYESFFMPAGLLYNYAQGGYGLYSYGLYSHGLYSYGLYK